MNKLLKNITYLTVIILILLPACSSKKSSLKLINVLDKSLYNDMRIAGSEQVDLDAIEQKVAVDWKNLDKNTVFIFYCSNYACTGSLDAARILTKHDFKNVYAYEGGMAEWYNLYKQDKTYKIEARPLILKMLQEQKEISGEKLGANRYLLLPNPAHEAPSDVKVVSAQQLKQMLMDNHVKGW